MSAAIIEDKTGLKQNSLFGTERKQQLDAIPDFQAKIVAGQKAKRSADFMIIARLEALIAGAPFCIWHPTAIFSNGYARDGCVITPIGDNTGMQYSASVMTYFHCNFFKRFISR